MSEPTPDPFIHPRISQIAALVQSGKATPEDLAKPFSVKWPGIPPELLPFVQSPTLSTLAEVLTSHPRFYWHPLVCCQMLRLLRLRHDEEEWQRLGWGPQYDEEGHHWPPAEVTDVNQWLERLAEAHVSGLFPHKRLHWTQHPKRRGPKSGFRNPHPAEGWAEWIDAASLDEDFRELWSAFKTRLKEHRRSVPRFKADAKTWYQNLAQAVLAQSRIEWSGLKECEITQYPVASPPAEDLCHPGPSAPAHPQDRELWLDTSVPSYVLKRYDMASATWATAMTFKTQDLPQALETVKGIYGPMPDEEYTEWWKPLELDTALDRMLLAGHKGDKEQDGKPAYLAYAVLGALLGVPPEKIRNTLDNFRHKRRPKPTR